MKRFCVGWLAFACAGVVLSAPAAEAGTVNASVTVDLTTEISASSSWNFTQYALDNPVRVYNGDTVSIHVDFLGSQALTWGSNGNLFNWMIINGGPEQAGVFTITNLSLTLDGLTQGTQLPAGLMGDQTNGSVHLGPTLFVSDNVQRTFQGMTAMFVATFTDGDPYRDYGFALPNFGGTVSMAASAEATTPLPAAAPAGLALIGAMGLKRRRKATA